MTTFPLYKPSFLFQGSASELGYASESMKWIWTNWQISVLAKMHIVLPFHLILTY